MSDPLEAIAASRAEEQLSLEWLTVKEYADLRRVHVQTVYSAIRYGRFTCAVERVGRAIRIGVSRESIRGHTAA